MLPVTFNVQFSCLRFFHYCLWLLVGLLLGGSIAQAEIKTGDILVIDAIGGTNGSGALFLVNPTTGNRVVLSDFGNSLQGSLGNGDLTGVTVGKTGRIFVSTLFSGDPAFVGGAIFEVDPDTGDRTIVSNFSEGDIQGNLYYGLAVDAKGRVIANLQQGFGLPFPTGIVRVTPKIDTRVLVSDLSNPDQGDTLLFPDSFVTDLTKERFGEILIGAEYSIDFNTGTAKAAIIRVNPKTGNRRLLSDFANPAQGTDVGDLFFSTGLAVETSGKIVVASGGSIFAPRNLLFRIHPKTGRRTVLSDFDNPAQGIIGISLNGVAVEDSRQILVGADDPTTGANSLFRVNPATGRRTILSDSNNPAQGSPFSALIYIAVVPEDSDAEEGDRSLRK